MVSDSQCSAALQTLELETLSLIMKTFIKLHGYLLTITERMKSTISLSVADNGHHYKRLEF